MKRNLALLVVGGGGREHALGWKLKQSKDVGNIYFAPGNAGTAQIGTNVAIQATDITPLLKFARDRRIHLTIVGPDDALALGIVDDFQSAGLRIFGPTKAAAQIESSKAFAKNLMTTWSIPTAPYLTFTDHEKALQYVHNGGMFRPCMIKANGLALGKGAVPCHTFLDAKEALHEIMVEKKFGDAGNTVVIEDFLCGHEFSAHAIVHGEKFVLFPFAQDHKAALDGGKGENTGGMGTIAPLPWATKGIQDYVSDVVIESVLMGLKDGGMPFTGCLFPGLIQVGHLPTVLEYNARFGDPETQVFMRLLKSDLLELLDASVDNNLQSIDVKWQRGFAVCVVLASQGYPGVHQKEERLITGIKDAQKIPGIVVFHAGTKDTNSGIVTSGGRVLGVSAYAKTLKCAIANAYDAIDFIHFDGMHYRTDIGREALALM